MSTAPPPPPCLVFYPCVVQAVKSKVLELKEEEQTFTFEDVASEPIPSLLRYAVTAVL